MHDLVALFCAIDDFWKTFKSEWDSYLIESKRGRIGPRSQMSISEMMTIMIL